jgi:hypothetical protein
LHGVIPARRAEMREKYISNNSRDQVGRRSSVIHIQF